MSAVAFLQARRARWFGEAILRCDLIEFSAVADWLDIRKGVSTETSVAANKHSMTCANPQCSVNSGSTVRSRSPMSHIYQSRRRLIASAGCHCG